jgi:GNAT superfamily N-acetyltransferase
MEWHRDGFVISDERARLDLNRIRQLLAETYWAADRPVAVIETSLANSVGFGLFEATSQIGFARLVSDRATFAWLCDVVIDPAYRGQSLGKWLIECVLSHPAAQVSQQLLRTKDAQALYEGLGFRRQECLSRRPSGAEAWDVAPMSR